MIQRLCLILSFVLSVPLTLYSQTPTYEEVQTLMNKYLPSSSEVGIAVYNLSTNQWVYQHNAYKLSRPASTMKLITGITALAYDAPQFTTTVWYDGEIKDATLHGNLYVVGSMDPEFDDSKMNQLADAVCKLKIKTITGNIYGDVALKDSLYWGVGWGWDDNPNAYQPYLSPLMYNKGKITIIAKPNNPGQKANLLLSPETSYFSVTNKTNSKNPKAGKFTATRDWLENKNDITVSGNVDRYRIRELNVVHPELFFLYTFQDKLSKKGIVLKGSYKVKEFAKTFKSKQVCAINTSIQEVLVPMLKESDNLNAESLLIRLGRKNKVKHISAEDGIEYIDSLLLQINENPSSYRFRDGSGLSSYNLVSPTLLVNILRYAYRNPKIYSQILEGMPIAGIDGTLSYRMKNTPAYRKTKAKTGTINAISSLAGYAENSKGEILAFAILNQNILKTINAHRFQDALCALLCR